MVASNVRYTIAARATNSTAARTQATNVSAIVVRARAAGCTSMPP
jgi:hypothetical protein